MTAPSQEPGPGQEPPGLPIDHPAIVSLLTAAAQYRNHAAERTHGTRGGIKAAAMVTAYTNAIVTVTGEDREAVRAAVERLR